MLHNFNCEATTLRYSWPCTFSLVITNRWDPVGFSGSCQTNSSVSERTFRRAPSHWERRQAWSSTSILHIHLLLDDEGCSVEVGLMFLLTKKSCCMIMYVTLSVVSQSWMNWTSDLTRSIYCCAAWSFKIRQLAPWFQKLFYQQLNDHLILFRVSREIHF